MSNPTMLMQRGEYIQNNPIKRGYVDLPEYWRYFSARAYLGAGEFVAHGFASLIPQAELVRQAFPKLKLGNERY